MPAATCQAPGLPASRTTTRAPRCAARHAQARPIAPPPTTATSKLSNCADTAVYGLPTPARPGSGSTVGAPVAPSQPDCELPCEPSWYPLEGDATRATRHHAAVPRLPREAARVDRGGGARRRRPRAAARQDTRRRRDPRRGRRIPRPRGAVHPQRPPGTRGGLRRRRRPRRPGGRLARGGAGARRPRSDRRTLDARARAGSERRRRPRRRLPGGRARARDADQAGTAGGGPALRGARGEHGRQAVVRDRRPGREQRARGRRARRDADRRRARDHRGRRPRGGSAGTEGGAVSERSKERTAAIQAQLQPLGPDERPLGIKLAVALALFLAAANIVALIAGHRGNLVGGLIFTALMLGAAKGLWERRYWIVLAFEALLGLSIVLSALSLAFASNAVAVVVAGAVVVICAPIFWLLVRVMARMQVPRQ